MEEKQKRAKLAKEKAEKEKEERKKKKAGGIDLNAGKRFVYRRSLCIDK